jgi:LPS-assembly protein
MRGDVYHSDENLLTAIPGYRGKCGLVKRAVDRRDRRRMRWPFVGEFMRRHADADPARPDRRDPRRSRISTFRTRIRAHSTSRTAICSRSIASTGHDRFEDGARITYGVEWNFSRPGFNISSVVGQSYRLSDKSSPVSRRHGLTNRTSDVVGRTTVAYRDFVRLTHRFRLDKDNLAIRRNEFDATIGSRSTYAVLGYSRLNRDILLLGEESAGPRGSPRRRTRRRCEKLVGVRIGDRRSDAAHRRSDEFGGRLRTDSPSARRRL